MSKNSFEILGVSSNTTQDELDEAYKNARAKWESKRFLPGAEGAEACEKLDEIDRAYELAKQELEAEQFVTDYDDMLKQADNLIKEKKYADAQEILDKITSRTAEWHFLQSIIHYANGRVTDATESLCLATTLEPYNKKYQDAYEKIRTKKQNTNYNRSYANDEGPRSYRDDGMERRGALNTCTNGLCMLCCADSCCECMGGDLISCC